MTAPSSDFLPAATTLHLVPREIWERSMHAPSYVPDSFAAEGFVHCTNGDDELIAVGNRYYRSDPRPYLVLTIAIDKLESPVRYDDPGRVFPHIYGPVQRRAVVSSREVMRADDGTFLSISSKATPL